MLLIFVDSSCEWNNCHCPPQLKMSPNKIVKLKKTHNTKVFTVFLKFAYLLFSEFTVALCIFLQRANSGGIHMKHPTEDNSSAIQSRQQRFWCKFCLQACGEGLNRHLKHVRLFLSGCNCVYLCGCIVQLPNVNFCRLLFEVWSSWFNGVQQGFWLEAAL